jgi:4-hydroxy-tetrahydrodipicolinate synthase
MNQASKNPTSGLMNYIIPLTTPFDGQGNIDREAARHNVEHTLRIPGCGGLYFGSVYQEFWTLTIAERVSLLGIVAEQLHGRKPLIAGVSSPSARDTAQLAAQAEAASVPFLMIWPPFWGPRNDAGVLEWYRRVMEKVATPTFIYSTTLKELDYHLHADLLECLMDEFPQICGVKDGTGNVSHFLGLTSRFGDRLAVASTFEEYLALALQAYPSKAATFLLGASRPMYMQTPEHPYLWQALEAIRNGEYEIAFGFIDNVSSLIEAQMDSFRRGIHPVALVKFAACLLGQRGSEVRPPLPALTPNDEQEVRQLLAGAGLFG